MSDRAFRMPKCKHKAKRVRIRVDVPCMCEKSPCRMSVLVCPQCYTPDLRRVEAVKRG